MSHGCMHARTDGTCVHARACTRTHARACVHTKYTTVLKLVIADVAALLRPVPVVPWGGASLVPVIKTGGRV